MLKVKVSTLYPDWPFLRQTPNQSGQWGGCQFFVDQGIDECDYWIVCEGVLTTEACLCPPHNTLFVAWEPPTVERYDGYFLKQFTNVLTCQREIRHRGATYSQQGHPWFIERSYDELRWNAVENKTKLLSVVCSDKRFTKGHAVRYEFAQAVKSYFGNDVDLFGRGVNEFKDKWDVLAPYKYSIAIENLAHSDWLTEKLMDCFLTETFPFYYGCLNIQDYFASDCLTLIDINDFGKSIKTIERIISDPNHYSTHKANVVEAKYKYLDHYSMFPLLMNLIHKHYIKSDRKLIEINPQSTKRPTILSKLKKTISAVIKTSQ